MKKSNIRNTLGAYLFSKVYICVVKIADLDDIANLEILPYCLHFLEVSNGAKIRNRYNQVPHLTQDTNGKVTNSQKTPQTRAKRSCHLLKLSKMMGNIYVIGCYKVMVPLPEC